MEPLRDFQFRGVPHRTTATLVPYVDCLVEITEMPFTVVTIADINIANLERVGFGLRNFDLTFVFKVRSERGCALKERGGKARHSTGLLTLLIHPSEIALHYRPVSLRQCCQSYAMQPAPSYIVSEITVSCI